MAKGGNTGGLIALLALGAAGVAIMGGKGKKGGIPATPPTLTGKPTDFILAMYPYAREANKTYPQIPIEIMLAFSGLESGWGKSAPKFNFFGTKPGKNYPGKIQQFDTTEVLPKATGYTFPKVYSVTKRTDGKYTWKVRDNFRAFDTPLGAYLDFCKFLLGARYKNCFQSKDVKTVVTCIWKSGYATDPKYVDKIMKLIGVIRDVLKSA